MLYPEYFFPRRTDAAPADMKDIGIPLHATYGGVGGGGGP